MNILDILLAIFLPPIAVLMRFGLGSDFLINLLLTIVGWLPGSVHALYILSRDGKGRS